MPKTYLMKYKQFTGARFNIGNLATLLTYELYVERGYHKSCIDGNIARISKAVE